MERLRPPIPETDPNAGDMAAPGLMTRPWRTIQETYESRLQALPQLQSMVRLVEQVRGCQLSRLHAWTSMHDLYIVQQPVSHADYGPRLLVSPKFDGNIELRYIDTRIEKRQWRRLLPEDLIFARLLRFTDELRWFPHVGKGPDA